ncbi:MAG: acyl-CoA dehydrogenase family protein, partial [Mycobacterium sp.]
MVATVTDEQFAARELVRDWARNSASGQGGTTAIRSMEQGDADAWRPVFAGLAELGLFGVAVAEDSGGAGGSIEDLCAMVEEAARALVPGPVATTALASLVVDDRELLAALAGGERFVGVAIEGSVRFDAATARASGSVSWVLGAADGGVLLLPADGKWLLVDTASEGVQVEPLRATDFSRPLARVVLKSAPATLIGRSGRRVEDLAATVLAAEAAGVTRWSLETAVAYAKVREQFGQPIGSFQAIKHLCAEMLCRAEQAEVAAADAARAAGDSSDAEARQFAIAAALAASVGIAAAKANVKDCIQVLGGIGCTWEHDAHLYLRRAHSIGRFLGGAEHWLRRITALTQDGVRRRLGLDLSDQKEVQAMRPEIAAAVAEVAAQPE